MICCADRIDTPAGACFSADRAHRYALWRRWDLSKPRLIVLMLNPSVADETELDPTLRRVRGFAQAWGYGGFLVLNAFSLVSTSPEGLRDASRDSATNDAHIRHYAGKAHVVLGWGGNLCRGHLRYRRAQLAQLLADADTWAFKVSPGNGEPSHPLYLPKATEPVPFRP